MICDVHSITGILCSFATYSSGTKNMTSFDKYKNENLENAYIKVIDAVYFFTKTFLSMQCI